MAKRITSYETEPERAVSKRSRHSNNSTVSDTIDSDSRVRPIPILQASTSPVIRPTDDSWSLTRSPLHSARTDAIFRPSAPTTGPFVPLTRVRAVSEDCGDGMGEHTQASKHLPTPRIHLRMRPMSFNPFAPFLGDDEPTFQPIAESPRSTVHIWDHDGSILQTPKVSVAAPSLTPPPRIHSAKEEDFSPENPPPELMMPFLP